MDMYMKFFLFFSGNFLCRILYRKFFLDSVKNSLLFVDNFIEKGSVLFYLTTSDYCIYHKHS